MLTRNRNRSFSKALQQGTAMTLISMMAFSGTAMAQDAIVSSSQAGAPVAAAADEDIQEVVVVGARAAQQSANDRKKRAKTMTDSIVADDVGAFPDRNVNEAISRIAGVALQRDDFGEGSTINIRGNEMDAIRIEMDGLGVAAAGIPGTGRGDQRSADLSALPSDLIKSVDVVKGSTADMTEGSLGGSVRIQTRTGLDFAKPYLQLRIGGRRNSLGEMWKPDYNLIASRKFFDGRLGVLLNVTGSEVQSNNNGQGVHGNNAGYQGRIDFDNSPEKTFEFNPSTLTSDPVAGVDTLIANSSFTPRQLVEQSAAAQTKAACYAAFPFITTGGTSTAANNIRNQRVYELQNCLNQWNDLEPNLVRSFDNTQYDKRFSADLRFDFRVNDRLTVYAKFNKNTREVDRQYRWRSLQGGQETPLNPGAVWTATGNPNGAWYVGSTVAGVQNRAVAPGNTRYFLYDGVWGPNANQAATGIVAGIDPSTVKVDANHYVTEYTLTDAVSNINQGWEPFEVDAQYMQFGGTYNHEDLKIEFIAGKSESESKRQNISTNRSFNYGAARFFVQPSGLWSHEILGAYDETNPSNYVFLNPQAASAAVVASVNGPAIPAYTVAQRPRVSTSFGLNYDLWLSEWSEETAKLDVTYNIEAKVPFFTQFKAGVSYRNPQSTNWNNPGGRTISSGSGTFGQPGFVAPVILPTTRLRGTFRACEPTSTSIEPCNFGYVANTNLSTSMTGVMTYTPAELLNLIASTSLAPDSTFFNDYEGAEDLENWQGIDVRKIMSLVPAAQNFNMNCAKTCVASDGNVYAQPFVAFDEKFTAAYYMLDFEQELPFNLLFNGNFGLRVVEADVTGAGDMTITSINTNGAFDPANPAAAAGITTTTYSKNVAFTKTTRDYIPSYNANLWLKPDELVLRYYKAKTVARPQVSQLTAVANCTIDERRTLGLDGYDDEYTCSGRVGNPGLKPYTAWNESATLEWYPNRDTMLSFAVHKLDVRTGGVISISRSEALFAGTGIVDPVTGESLDNLQFTFPSWGNAGPYERTGWEITSKTAFTFLPWYLRYTGADFNYSELGNTQSQSIINPNTGEALPPIGESKYFANLSLWYDDGKTNARVSWQARAESFRCIEACGSNTRNNFPSDINVAARPVPWQPGNPMFTDETLYVDAKITHKLRPNVDIFVEGRNLTKEAQTISAKRGETFESGAPYLHNLQYGGRSFSFGVIYRMQ